MSATLQVSQPVTTAPKTAFLDQIRLRHGPIAQLGRFFLAAEQAAHDIGISLQLHTDMESLCEAYREVQPPGRPVPALPVFDPAYNDLSAANSFWISGHNTGGQLVATQAARFFDLNGSTIEEELTSLRLLYADPAPALAAGMRIEVDCPPAREICGRVTYTGGAYYHKSVRGLGLSRIMPRISRALAYSQWNTEWTAGWVETVLVEKNVHASYGYTRHCPSIKLIGTNRGNAECELVWMQPGEMLDDLSNYASAATSKIDRKTDTPDTNSAPPRRQGSNNRS